uniref:Uncharacterized protein n=1 Tax=Anguilla anguilla TaxID=7936 RepID=A0A0E9RLP0_ANGAN
MVVLTHHGMLKLVSTF